MSVAASVDKQIVQLPETRLGKIIRETTNEVPLVAVGKMVVELPEKGVEKLKIPEKVKKDLTKTKLCDYFRRGNCGAGETCPFAHHVSELRSAPNLAKTGLCAAFEQGHCVKGDRCTYAHGEAELVKPPSYKKKMCVWHKDGKCRHGVKCGFAHSVSELDAESQAARKEFFECKKAAAKKAASEFDYEASTAVPSTDSLSMADSDVSRTSKVPIPGEHVFRMIAGSGSAPTHHQVHSMRLAIGDLQAKLAQIEDQAMQSTVDEMKDTIKTLVQQCEEVEAQLGPTKQSSRPPQGKKVQRIPASTSKTGGLQTKPTLWAQLSQSRDNVAVKATLGVLLFAICVMAELGLR